MKENGQIIVIPIKQTLLIAFAITNFNKFIPTTGTILTNKKGL